MQIVIDIDDMTYEFVQNTSFIEDESTLFKQTNADRKKTLFLFDILDAIKNGTPLPKGHGAIKDVSQIEIPMCEDRAYETWVQVAINAAPTIIEADIESEDKK